MIQLFDKIRNFVKTSMNDGNALDLSMRTTLQSKIIAKLSKPRF